MRITEKSGLCEAEEICLAALERWGAESQMLMVMEEMAELQKELCKNRRRADKRAEGGINMNKTKIEWCDCTWNPVTG